MASTELLDRMIYAKCGRDPERAEPDSENEERLELHQADSAHLNQIYSSAATARVSGRA